MRRAGGIYILTKTYAITVGARLLPAGSVVVIVSICNPWGNLSRVVVATLDGSIEHSVLRDHLREPTPLELLALQSE